MTPLKPAAMDMPAVTAYLSLSDSTVEELVRQGAFPRPRQLSPRRKGWLTREIDQWLEDRPVADMLPPTNSGYGRAGTPGKASRKSESLPSQ